MLSQRQLDIYAEPSSSNSNTPVSSDRFVIHGVSSVLQIPVTREAIDQEPHGDLADNPNEISPEYLLLDGNGK